MKEETDNDDLNDDLNNDLRNGILLIVLVILLWLVFGIISYYILPKWSERGQLGDMFGVVNSLFSGLAFAGVIYTILLQRKELSLQRKELKDTRTVFQTQSSIMKLQQRENVFFQMLENHRGIVNSLNLRDTVSNSKSNGGTEKTTLQLMGHEVIEKIFDTYSTGNLKDLSCLIFERKGKASSYYYIHPESSLKRINDLDYIFKSILFNIEFVQDQLKNDIIYHKILYNALSKNEKILIGVFSNLIDNKDRKNIEKSSFDYFEEYYFSGFKKTDVTDIPYFQFNSLNNNDTNINIGEFNFLPNLSITNLSNIPLKVLELYTSNEKNSSEKIFKHSFNYELLKNSPVEFSLDSYFNYLILKDQNFKSLLDSNQKRYENTFEVSLEFMEMTFIAKFSLIVIWQKMKDKETLQFTIR